MKESVYNNEKLQGLLYWSAKYISEYYCNRGFAEISVWPERLHGPHLVMRLDNQLFLIYLEIEISGIVENVVTDETMKAMIMLAELTKGIPSTTRVCLTLLDDNMHASINNVENLKDIKCNSYIDFNKFNYNELVEISEWELLDFATHLAINQLKGIGHIISRYDTRPEREAPFIISEFNGETFQTFVCASRIGDVVPCFNDEFRMRIAIIKKIKEYRILVAPITISNFDSFQGDGKIEWKPLYRGKPTVAREFKFEELTVYKK